MRTVTKSPASPVPLIVGVPVAMVDPLAGAVIAGAGGVAVLTVKVSAAEASGACSGRVHLGCGDAMTGVTQSGRRREGPSAVGGNRYRRSRRDPVDEDGDQVTRLARPADRRSGIGDRAAVCWRRNHRGRRCRSVDRERVGCRSHGAGSGRVYLGCGDAMARIAESGRRREGPGAVGGDRNRRSRRDPVDEDGDQVTSFAGAADRRSARCNGRPVGRRRNHRSRRGGAVDRERVGSRSRRSSFRQHSPPLR